MVQLLEVGKPQPKIACILVEKDYQTPLLRAGVPHVPSSEGDPILGLDLYVLIVYFALFWGAVALYVVTAVPDRHAWKVEHLVLKRVEQGQRCNREDPYIKGGLPNRLCTALVVHCIVFYKYTMR